MGRQSSILVPSVQELAKQDLERVPARYLRPDQELPTASGFLGNSIPIIDLKSLNLQDHTELQKLHIACRDWGFFQLVNHGVSSSVVEGMKSEIQLLFKLPLEEKRKYWQMPGNVEGFGQAFVVSEDQTLDWSDMFYLTTLPAQLRKSRLFDHLPPSFRETMEAYCIEVNKLAMSILGFISRALGVKDEEITGLFDGGIQSLRMNYYPPCPQSDSVIGISPHSDGGGLTILLQVNEVEGLQIRKDGMWIPVKPLPGAFIVNIGDILEIITNGVYRSIEHRATVNSGPERLSVAAFQSPRVTAEIGPAASLISPEQPALFKRLGVDKYLEDLFARKLQGKAYVDSMRTNHEMEASASTDLEALHS